MEQKHLKVVLATGGSGGHLFPALETGKVLQAQGHYCLFLGSFGIGRERIEKAGFHYKNFYLQGLKSKNPIYVFQTAFLMFKAFLGSVKELKAFEADVVAGFGGYGSFSTVCAAIMLRIPTVIHEQNVVPGRANRLLARFVSKVAVSFSESKKYFDVNKTVVTGCPSHIKETHYDREKVLKELNLKEGKFTILVFGGSQGSQRINQVLLEALDGLKQKIDLQIIHITGKKDFREVEEKYKNQDFPHVLFDFCDQMGKVYSVSDLVISRSGASSVIEIAMFKKPSVLIPYPYAQGHQKENAEVLASRQLAWLIEEKDLNAEKIVSTVLEIQKQSSLLVDKTSKGFEEAYVANAATKLAEEITSLG